MNLRLFRSVKFNVALFLVIAGASALGTFLPQRNEAPEKVEAFIEARPRLGPALDAAGFFNFYHAPWFIFLLGLMAFDVTMCKLKALPRNIHGEDKLEERLIQTSPLRQDFVLAAPLSAARDKVRGVLGGRAFKFRETAGPGEVHLWAARHRLQRWGDFVLHVTIVVILWGAAIGGLFGFEEFLPVNEGGVKSLENRPWIVAVDDFEVEFYQNSGAARKYASHLRVVNTEGDEIARKRIVVNDPLDVGGVRFYQASWGMTGMLKQASLMVPRAGGEGAVFTLPWKERVALEPKAGLSAEAKMLFPDFAVTEDGRATTASMEPKNPAVLVQFYAREEPVAAVWILKNHPALCFKSLPDGRVAPEPHPPFVLKDFTPVLFTGLQVGFDPGAPLVGWACAGLLLGLCLHFYLHQRRLRILLTEEEGGRVRVRVGGWSSRSGTDFEPEFRSLMEALRA